MVASPVPSDSIILSDEDDLSQDEEREDEDVSSFQSDIKSSHNSNELNEVHDSIQYDLSSQDDSQNSIN